MIPPTVPNYDEVWDKIYGDMQETGPVHRHLHRIVHKLLTTLDYDSVLDVGSGPGYNYGLLTQGRKLDFGGMDISAAAINQARNSFNGEFWQGDIQQEQTPVERTWDLVYCSLVLEHLPKDEAALRNMRKMTGRYLLVTTIAGNYERYRVWDERVGHVRNYQAGELEQKLIAAGYKVRESIYWGFPFYNPLARTLQNYTKVGTAKFNKTTKIVANFLYWLYFLNLSRHGDLLIILAEV